jgi:hypothetical protein
VSPSTSATCSARANACVELRNRGDGLTLTGTAQVPFLVLFEVCDAAPLLHTPGGSLRWTPGPPSPPRLPVPSPPPARAPASEPTPAPLPDISASLSALAVAGVAQLPDTVEARSARLRSAGAPASPLAAESPDSEPSPEAAQLAMQALAQASGGMHRSPHGYGYGDDAEDDGSGVGLARTASAPAVLALAVPAAAATVPWQQQLQPVQPAAAAARRRTPFTERAAERDVRLRAVSPFGVLPRWRMLVYWCRRWCADNECQTRWG